MLTVSYCHKCGFELEGNESFCPQCGQEQKVAKYKEHQPSEPPAFKSKKKAIFFSVAATLLLVVVGAIFLNFILLGDQGTSERNKIVDQSQKVTDKTATEEPIFDGQTGEVIRGNSSGNIVNGGLVAQQNDWIFYVNPSDNDRIYKVRFDGIGRVRVTNDRAHYINVIGEWIYFSNRDDRDRIYRINTDGANQSSVNDDSSAYVTVIGDWIYYVNRSSQFNIYRIRTDGSEKMRLNYLPSAAINLVSDWIYYTPAYFVDGSQSILQADEIRKICTVDIKEITIAKGSASLDNNRLSSHMQLVDDWIYYRIQMTDDQQIYRIRTDGTERTRISDDLVGDFHVTNDWIYYANHSDNSRFYKMRVDGTQRTRINSDHPKHIHILGDWIYYQNLHDNRLYKIRLDGTSRRVAI